MVARTVTQYARAGVAALHIEDQVQTKRCGHLLGKQVVSREEFVTRIRAAVIARDSIPGNSDLVSLSRRREMSMTRHPVADMYMCWVIEPGYHRENGLGPGPGNGRGDRSAEARG